jgi:hypothetical protein
MHVFWWGQIFAVHILHILRCLKIVLEENYTVYNYKISLKYGNNLNYNIPYLYVAIESIKSNVAYAGLRQLKGFKKRLSASYVERQIFSGKIALKNLIGPNIAFKL